MKKMSAKHYRQDVKVRWPREGYKEFMKGRRTDMNRADRSNLRRCFNRLAKKSETFAHAINWAHNNGVLFFIDHKMSGASGYYMPAQGLIGISMEAFLGSDDARLVDIFTHEIRHAWQDASGLMPVGTSAPLTARYIRTAIFEADAHAHGQLASDEVKHGAMLQQGKVNSLRNAFKGWFTTGTRADYYGQRVTAQVARGLGLAVAAKDPVVIEYTAAVAVYPSDGFGISDARAVSGMGDLWSGGNYLRSQDMRDFLTHVVLSPTQAGTYYKQDGRKLKADVCKIRKAEIRAGSHCRRINHIMDF